MCNNIQNRMGDAQIEFTPFFMSCLVPRRLYPIRARPVETRGISSDGRVAADEPPVSSGRPVSRSQHAWTHHRLGRSECTQHT